MNDPLNLYKETIHHHDRHYMRVYRDYLTLYQSPVKAALMRVLEQYGDGWLVLHSESLGLLLETFGLDEKGLTAVVEDLVEMGHVEYSYNGTNHLYRIRAGVVQRALNQMEHTDRNS